MKMTFRWYGKDSDKITLKQIKQIPNCTGLMGVLDYKAAGEVWTEEEIKDYMDYVQMCIRDSIHSGRRPRQPRRFRPDEHRPAHGRSRAPRAHRRELHLLRA